jgi:hypothetical protein
MRWRVGNMMMKVENKGVRMTTTTGVDEVMIADSQKRKVILTRTDGMPMVSIREVKCVGGRNHHQEVTLVDEELARVALELMRPSPGQAAAAEGDQPELGALAVKAVVEALAAALAFRAGDVVGGIEHTSAAFQAAAKLRFKAHGQLALKKQLDAETQTHTDEH